MFKPYVQAPHAAGQPGVAGSESPNAALLIDFDNVTMGMRTDLAKELKNLLNSDIIKGKVTVQRAYADWRRYPQYIVPLSEASVDLIFAPAYGSNKKNATDIRMAIDGIELVFIRPEIGTFILLTGDSDFSSLVLKLKEYGKYVIGVGIQESSSDILVQNCDEYYSYTSLTGLKKTGEGGAPDGMDPWVLVERALAKMVEREDVMRSDRLKQVMVEINPGFHEKDYGFSKFSRFLTEASSKGLVQLHKEDNGQYRVAPGGRGGKAGGSGASRGESRRGSSRGDRSRGGRSDGRRGDGRREGGRRGEDRGGRGGQVRAAEGAGAPSQGADTVDEAWVLLRRALAELMDDGRDAARDSDVKRRMLALDPGFDEAEYGFGKFSLFLRQAHDLEVVEIRKREDGNYEVVPGTGPLPTGDGATAAEGPGMEGTGAAGRPDSPEPAGTSAPSTFVAVDLDELELPPVSALGSRPRTRRGRGSDAPPMIFDGQVVSVESAAASSAPTTAPEAQVDAPPLSSARARGPAGPFDAAELGLPTDGPAAVRYLANSYGGGRGEDRRGARRGVRRGALRGPARRSRSNLDRDPAGAGGAGARGVAQGLRAPVPELTAHRIAVPPRSARGGVGPAALDRGALEAAPALLGWTLRSEIGGAVVEGRIVEVEAYLGREDPASHAAVKAGRTRRNASMYGPAGHLYVYRSYGIHWCANVVTGPEGAPSAVLLRALEPLTGDDVIARRRGRPADPCNGPGRLAQALGIDGGLDGHDLARVPVQLLPGDPLNPDSVGRSPRIGITRATDAPLRFFELGNPHLSRR